MSVLRVAYLAAILTTVLFALWRPSDAGGVASGFEGRLLDARFLARGPMPAPDSVAILAIDDASLEALDAFPPPRTALAAGLTAAQDAGAVAVAFDLLLVGKGTGDAAFETALARDDRAILAVSLSGTKTVWTESELTRALTRSALSLVVGAPPTGAVGGLGPNEAFAAAATLAHVNVQPEADGALRRIPLVNQAGPSLVLPVLPLAAARRALDLPRSAVTLNWGASIRLGDHLIPLDLNNEVGVNFYGPQGQIPTYSLIEAKSADLAGRIVFIGASAEGYGDRFATPYDRQMPGVEVLASLAANLVAGTQLRRDDVTWGGDVGLALLAVVLAVWAASRSRPVMAVGATGCVWLVFGGGLYLAFLQGLWLDGTSLLMALISGTIAGGAARRLLHRQYASNLARYHSPLLSDVLAQNKRPAFDGREQDAAVLFVDAADFTARSERLGPAGTSAFLRSFHRIVEQTATAHSGMVEQYAGDGAMICFGLPDPSPHDATNALRCADALFDGIKTLNADLARSGQPPARIRIGCHFGQVVAAVLGGDRQGHVTFVGDVVNTASRLQEVAKDLNAELVVSSDVLAGAGDVSDMGLTHHGTRTLRGRDGALDVWIRLVQPKQSQPDPGKDI